MEEVLNGSCVS